MRNVTSKGRTGETARRVLTMMLAAITLFVSAGASAEETKKPAVSADVTVASKYVWRGLRLTDDPVLQPSLTVDYKGLGLNIWANTDLTDVNGTPGQTNELDYTLSYSFAVDKAELSFGVIQYTFPHTSFEPTTEIYGTATMDYLLSPTATIYWDTDEVGGVYATLGIGHSFPLGDLYRGISPSLDLSGSIGYATSNWNKGYYGVNSSGLVDLLLTAGFAIPIDDHLSTGLFVSFSSVVDSDLRDAVDNNQTTSFGATLSYAF